MENKYIKFSNYLPLHLWNLKELGGDRIIETSFTKSKKSNTVMFSAKLKKPCSKLIKKW